MGEVVRRLKLERESVWKKFNPKQQQHRQRRRPRRLRSRRANRGAKIVRLAPLEKAVEKTGASGATTAVVPLATTGAARSAEVSEERRADGLVEDVPSRGRPKSSSRS